MKSMAAREQSEGRSSSVGLKELFVYFAFFGIFCLMLFAVGTYWEGTYHWTGLFLLYMSFPNTFIPLPTNPVIIGLGRMYEPVLVGILGAAGTSIANVNEYQIVSYLSERKFADRIKKRRLYLKFREWYWQFPFAILTLTNFLPIPVDPVRWLSISSGYGRFPYAVATFVGRAPRYYLLALIGEKYQVSNTILILLVAIPAVYSAVRFLVRKLGSHG